MKKSIPNPVFSILFRPCIVFLYLFFISLLSFGQCPQNAIIDAPTAPPIDGSVGGIWSKAPANTMTKVTIGSMPSDFSGTKWRAMFDATKIYILIEVKDGDLRNNSGANWWEDDAVEIFFEANKSTGTTYNGNDYQYAFRWNDGTIKSGSGSPSTSGVTFAMVAVSGGYNLVVTIPRSNIGSPTSVVGFDVQVDDDDGNGRNTVGAFSTSSSNAYSDPSSFGSVTLTTCNGNPILSLPTVSSITNTSAILGATVTSNNGSTLSARGTAYNTSTGVLAGNNTLAEGGASVAAYTHTRSGLSPQTQYYYVGYATNVVGTAISSESNFRTLSNPPTAIAGSFAATAATSTQINLSWTAATFPGTGATAKGYIVLLRTDGSSPAITGITNAVAPGSFSLPSGTTLLTTITSGTTLTFNHTGLTTGATYKYLLVPFTWDGTNAATYNYLTASAPLTNATTSSSPYGGIAVTIPGIIQAENYNLGGEGFGYHETNADNPINLGGQYRTSEGVDVENCSDVNGG
ncbi:MAG: hypothetical protein HY305_00830 [Sphingobacteriales bacterium]|nr:hypothetical protein [Sphingobacteriales bacterium]